MRPHVLLPLVVLLSVLAGLPARPTARAQPAPSSADLVKARRLFKQGLILYRLSKFEKALATFESALQAATKANIILNIAQCHRKLGHARKAIFNYKLYLTHWERKHPDRPSPYDAEIKGHIKQLEARLLQEREGALKIVSEPAGATIRIDGQPRPGKTPVVLQKLAKGEHGLELRKGDLRYSGRVQVVGGTQTEVRVVLARVLGAIEVTSTPAGAEIRLDGTVVGQTPRKLTSLAPGQHTLELRKAGYVKQQQLVAIDGAALRRVALTLPRLARLTVRSTPPGATVVVDGKAMGQAPVELELEPGKHAVALKAPGRQQIAREIEAAAGATVKLEETLALDSALQQQIDSRRSKRIWGWSTLSVAIAGTLTSLALISLGIAWDSNGSREYEQATVQSAIDEHYDEMVAGRNMITGGIVVGGVAVVALGVSIFQFATAPDAPEEGLRLGVGPAAGGGAALQIGGVY